MAGSVDWSSIIARIAVDIDVRDFEGFAVSLRMRTEGVDA
jgi:hypothetical protein